MTINTEYVMTKSVLKCSSSLSMTGSQKTTAGVNRQIRKTSGKQLTGTVVPLSVLQAPSTYSTVGSFTGCRGTSALVSGAEVPPLVLLLRFWSRSTSTSFFTDLCLQGCFSVHFLSLLSQLLLYHRFFSPLS